MHRQSLWMMNHMLNGLLPEPDPAQPSPAQMYMTPSQCHRRLTEVSRYLAAARASCKKRRRASLLLLPSPPPSSS